MCDTQDEYIKENTILISEQMYWDELGPKPDLSNINLENKQEYNNEHTRHGE